jgi:enoyl-CoA hydratase
MQTTSKASHALTVERLGPALVIRFTRPEVRNPLSVAVVESLLDILVSCSASRVIFSGTGDAFASGADLREVAAVGADDARGFALRGQKLMSCIEQLPCPTIAAINGYCFGGALDLALACDTRVASPAAKFAHPGSSLGIITGWGGTQRLPRLVGTMNALQMFFTAAPIDAERALSIGLVDAINDDPLAAALAG